MTRFYDAYRELYGTLYDDATHDFVAFQKDGGKILALRTTLSEAETLLHAMEQAYHEVRAKGGDTRTWLREIRRATFVTGAVRDLLIEAEDGSEQIIAAREAIDAVNVELAGIAKGAEALARDLGNASAAIDAVAKLVKLID